MGLGGNREEKKLRWLKCGSLWGYEVLLVVVEGGFLGSCCWDVCC